MASQELMLIDLTKPDLNDGSTPGLLNYKYQNQTLIPLLKTLMGGTAYGYDTTPQINSLCKQWILDYYYSSNNYNNYYTTIKPVMGITISTPLINPRYYTDGTLYDSNGTSTIGKDPIFTNLLEVPLYNSNSDHYFPQIKANENILSYITPYYSIEKSIVNMTYVLVRLDSIDESMYQPTALRLSAGLPTYSNISGV